MKKEKLIKNIIWCSLIVAFLFGIALLISVQFPGEHVSSLSIIFLLFWMFSIISSSVYVLFLIFNMRNIKLILHPLATFLGVSDIFSFITGIVMMYPGPELIGFLFYPAATLVLGSFILYKQFKSTSST